MAEQKIIVHWNKSAQLSLKSIYNFLSKDSFDYAERTVTELIEVSEKLLPFANKFPSDPIAGNPYRFLAHKNYRIVYRVFNKRINVHYVFDSRQDPNKLKKKIKNK